MFNLINSYFYLIEIDWEIWFDLKDIDRGKFMLMDTN